MSAAMMSAQERPLIVYVGSFRFPTGDAAAARVIGIAKALRLLGYEVIFGGGESAGRPEDSMGSGNFSYQGFSYAPQGGLDAPPVGVFHRALALRDWAQRVLRWMNGLQPRKIAAIIAYEPGTPLLLGLKKYARSHAIPLVIDLTEWPTGSVLPGGVFGLRNLESQFRMRFLHDGSDAVIAVSSFLSAYYRKRVCNVVRIPPLVDLDEEKWNRAGWEPSETLRLVYAGTPGNKDLLRNIVRGVLLATGTKRRIELHLIGVTRKQAAAQSRCDLESRVSEGIRITCHGRIPQNDVPGKVSGADFSVLLRPDNKNARAGFSTKLVESLSAGTPAIVNLTSDISEYLKNGREGLIVGGNSAEALAATLKVASGLSNQELQSMRGHARQRARESFDYPMYCSALKSLFEQLSLPRERGGS